MIYIQTITYCVCACVCACACVCVRVRTYVWAVWRENSSPRFIEHISGKVRSIEVVLCAIILRTIVEPKCIVNNKYLPSAPKQSRPNVGLISVSREAPIRSGHPISIDHH